MSSQNEGPVIGTTVGHAVAQDFIALASNLGSEAGIPPLPLGMPSHLSHALAWSGADFIHEANYIYLLTEANLAEISTALAYFKGLELDGDLVSRENFPLPALGVTLDSLSREVHDGRGFCVVRGIDPHKYTVEDLTLIYLGVQAYIADQRGRQDSRGNMLDSRLVMNFGRAALLGSVNHPRKPTLPVLTEKQREALDAVEAAARATELHIATRAGDMHFINNLAVLHRREGFVDGESAMEKRHLVRLRCRSTERGWRIPVPLQREWFDAFEREWDRIWHLEPMPDAFFPLRKYPN
ncbi:putative taurine catabolism dioxygenase protein [Phaeoacremonium minimum UCRPA7]|uniref:Putative taurine catabolism dioxygenase protein n=1 Tax=Phaeoacremonium minimum (strain UCR-PA7) TaxID=1286976 RepID=R8BSS6_PHAM7|nr:putative taurine catabolism dioxygenase protein [Phaeoacremonium minimum UCRPA7]EOO02443.1 putative taurine catabolism dioxygenase protein [Phaeoacremonium minimum UCRPA7]